MSPDKFGDVEGFVCIIARHPSFICNCNSRFIHLKNTSHFFKELKVRDYRISFLVDQSQIFYC